MRTTLGPIGAGEGETATLSAHCSQIKPELAKDFFPTWTQLDVAINLTLYGVIFILSLYLQQVRHYSPITFGVAFLPFPLVLLVSNLAAGWLNGKVGSRLLMVVGLLVAAVGYWLFSGLNPATPYIAMLPGLLVIPLGIGLAVPAMTTALLATVPRSRSGIASGVLNTVRQAGGAIGVALFGSFMARGAVHGIQLAFVASAAVAAAAAIVAVLGVRPVKEAPLKGSHEEKSSRRMN